MKADKATCRFDGLFWTDYAYNPIVIRHIDLPKVKEV